LIDLTGIENIETITSYVSIQENGLPLKCSNATDYLEFLMNDTISCQVYLTSDIMGNSLIKGDVSINNDITFISNITILGNLDLTDQSLTVQATLTVGSQFQVMSSSLTLTQNSYLNTRDIDISNSNINLEQNSFINITGCMKLLNSTMFINLENMTDNKHSYSVASFGCKDFSDDDIKIQFSEQPKCSNVTSEITDTSLTVLFGEDTSPSCSGGSSSDNSSVISRYWYVVLIGGLALVIIIILLIAFPLRQKFLPYRR